MIENVIGSAYDDTITGSAQANTLYSGAGNDVLDGSSSDDTLDGGAGNDVLKGGNGNDLLLGGAGNDSFDGETVSYVNATGGVTVSLLVRGAQTVGGGQGSDTMINVVNLIGSHFDDTLTASNYVGSSVYGGDGDDVIYGDSGHDILYGGDGNDVIHGGRIDGVSSDTMWGGAGNDRFVSSGTSSPVPGIGVIADFASGDILDVSNIDANVNTAGDQAFHLVSGFTHSAGEALVTYDADTNVTTVAFDTDGNAVGNTYVQLTGDVTALTGSWLL